MEYGENEKTNIYKNVEYINKFTNQMEKLKIPTYFILIPNSIYINKDKLPDNVDVINQEKIINEVYEKTNTINVVVTNEIKNINDITPLYFKTDHHMNSNGAYIVYSEFCKVANINQVSLDNFNKQIVSNNFLGTFDSKAQIYNQVPDEIFVYKNDINTNIKEAIYDRETTNSIFNESI